jgi:hypothetical protein
MPRLLTQAAPLAEPVLSANSHWNAVIVVVCAIVGAIAGHFVSRRPDTRDLAYRWLGGIIGVVVGVTVVAVLTQ